MTNYVRKNVWEAFNGGQFQDPTGKPTELYLYAKAVQVMQSRPISDPTSWWFYSAIHGQLLLNPITNPRFTYLNWVNIPYIPASANLGTLPSQKAIRLFWDQCQHGTWFFPPWHRGYLVALENILRDIIVNQLNGPSDWALPYWNYLNQSTKHPEYKIPPAFTASTLPDGTPNPLFVQERYGPNGDGNVFVTVGQDMENAANDECQWDTVYSESSPQQGGSGNLYGFFYGGGETGFAHNNSDFGDLESNPHNFVHVFVGGQNRVNGQSGLMAVPPTAALDPVFFLHHANIDRMWASWNETGKNSNPIDANWLNGPSAQGNSRFAMPLDANGTPWYYTPEEVQDTANLQFNGATYAYTYDDLSLTSYDTTPPNQERGELAKRLTNLGVTDVEKGIKVAGNRNSELVGASGGGISLASGETRTTVKLDSTAWKPVEKSLMRASVASPPDEVYLQLEGVKGANDANLLSVYVNQKFVKSVALFGLLMASRKDSNHGEAGLTFRINITGIIDNLHLDRNLPVDSLDVQIKTKNPIPNGTDITIDRVGIYRSGL